MSLYKPFCNNVLIFLHEVIFVYFSIKIITKRLLLIKVLKVLLEGDFRVMSARCRWDNELYATYEQISLHKSIIKYKCALNSNQYSHYKHINKVL